jgi:hypothetical protein
MYKNILNKSDLVKLGETKIKSINEAVDYDKSLLGAVISGIGKSISFFSGSIKKGIAKQKVKSLANQWSAEYARVTIEVYNEIESQPAKVSTDDNKTSTSNTKKYKIKVEDVKSLLTQLDQLTNILDSTKKWQFNKLDLMSSEYELFYNKIKDINIQYIDISELATLIDENDGLKQLEQYIKKLNEFLDIFKTSNDVKTVISAAGSIAKISDIIKQCYKLIEKITNGYKLVMDEITNNTSDDTDTDAETDTDADKTQNTSESLILEKEYKISKQVLKLVTPEILETLEKIPNIYKLTNAKLNYETLNTILYKVNLIIKKEASKNNDVTKLQSYWDLNYQDTNNYFQNVIDINNVKKQVDGKVNNPMVIEEIKNEEREIDELVKLGLDNVIEQGHKFDNTKLYSFVGNLKSYAKKEIKVNFILSPVSKYIDAHNDNKLFWFKLFGAYTVNKSGEISKINPFKKLTTNKQLIEAASIIDGHFYVAFENAITVGKPRVMYIYDASDGAVFFNNTKTTKVDKIKDTIIDVSKQHKTYNTAISELAITMNVFKLNIYQRFDIDEVNIQNNKYPGITIRDIEKDANIEKTKKLHNNIVKIINNNLRR